MTASRPHDSANARAGEPPPGPPSGPPSGPASEPASDPASGPQSRYVVGIDLGTTNCAVAYVDTDASDRRLTTFAIPQWTAFGQFESRETLPSFHYEWTSAEAASGPWCLPWESPQASPRTCIGFLARDAGQRHPGRRIASAKSWLSHDGVDRTADFLPWHSDPDVKRMSPVDASACYLAHIRAAWDDAHPDHPLRDQDVIVTLPASFDEVARELTVRAAKQAGLQRIYLIEEPQAAFYAWIDRHREDWHQIVRAGQLILVCDIGGGTTDLTLIRVRPAGDDRGHVQFHRVAVGRHLILGGDNMDLAVAKLGETESLSASQWDQLVQASRGAKEAMLRDRRPEAYTIHLAAEGARLLGGGRQIEITAKQIDEVLLDGFFPQVEFLAEPDRGQSGFQEFGLPYAADPAVTKHLAAFLREHRDSGADRPGESVGDTEELDAVGRRRPDLVLFNGGVMAAAPIRNRVVDSLVRWFREPGEDWTPQVLASPRLDLAVAQGAAYYGMVRHGDGVRIAANLGRSYYMQVSSDPPRALCLIPGMAEPGQRFRTEGHLLTARVGTPVQFPLWVSSTRLADAVGQMVAIDPAEMSPLPPICTALVRGRKREGGEIRVALESELSEIGTVGMHCVDRDSGRRWKLEFDIRSTLETDREAHSGGGEASGIVDHELVSASRGLIADTFAAARPDDPPPTARVDAGPNRRPTPARLVKQLESLTDTRRNRWPPSLLRELWQALIDSESGRRQSAAHEARWLNLVGFSLRPGYGMAVDDWRVQETWRLVHGKLAFPASQSRTESMIMWRRVAGGLTTGQQRQLAGPLIAGLRRRGGRVEPHESSEVWRLLGSLERLGAIDKVELGALAIQELGRKKSEKLRPALLWSLGRLGSRQPIYGPLNTTVSAGEVAAWLDVLLDLDPAEPGLSLAIAQMARLTGDRFRDVDGDLRRRAVTFLDQAQASSHLREIVLEGGSLDREEEAGVFGDTLPLGIRLARG